MATERKSVRIPTRQERKAEFKKRGIPFAPLYNGDRGVGSPLSIVLSRIEDINLERRPQPKPDAKGEVTESSAGSQGTEPPSTESEATT